MTQLDKLRKAAHGLLSGATKIPTADDIHEAIATLRRSFTVTDVEARALAHEFEDFHGVAIGDSAFLTQDHEPWLSNARKDIDFYYWNRYRRYLLEGHDFPDPVLASLDSVTDRILDFLQKPTDEGRWDRRGLVIGHVQSGKTANYTGLVCKAADAGYRVIVIIAGIHNNLRNQTQRRIDAGLLGFDTGRTLARNPSPARTPVGVGLFGLQRVPAAFTTARKDFAREIADNVGVSLQSLSEPAVFVIKKNPNTLENLIDWLSAHNARSGTRTVREPMLLIDDEADHASINIRQRESEISRINHQIRTLLHLFDRRCYVGYTATPFANIFIDPSNRDEMVGQDLFPRDFIVSLDPPTNYFGATRVFADETTRTVQHVHDDATVLPLRHKIDHLVNRIPGTLEAAVRVFIVARAIRLARGHRSRHNSMLVNASRFVAVQRQIRNQIHALVVRIRESVAVHGATPLHDAIRDPEIRALHSAWREQYAHIADVQWADVQPLLHESASAVNVVEVNRNAPGSLNYAEHGSTGLNIIAVGGYSLSRGLTLEGLVVSYFLRRSLMYDTLLQMGRWFGYRAGYEDLCRVWMPEEAEGWYAHIAESIGELRDEITAMQAAGATPEEFGLRVRSHPDALEVTARTKMGAGSVVRAKIGLANRFVETSILRNDRVSRDTNLRAAADLASRLRNSGAVFEQPPEVGGGRLVRCAPAQVVTEFLRAFQNHEGSLLTKTGPILEYIRQRESDELARWDVLFAGVTRKGASDKPLVDSSLGFPLFCQRRRAPAHQDRTTLRVSAKQRVSTRGIARIGVAESDARDAESDYDSRHATGTSKRSNYPDRIYGPVRRRALLVIHLLAIGKEEDDFRGKTPVAAWSISFPGTDREERTVEYVVNTTWLREHYADDDDEEDLVGDE